jgi:hypothetical protein
LSRPDRADRKTHKRRLEDAEDVVVPVERVPYVSPEGAMLRLEFYRKLEDGTLEPVMRHRWVPEDPRLPVRRVVFVGPEREPHPLDHVPEPGCTDMD